jgi:hypothetical protein
MKNNDENKSINGGDLYESENDRKHLQPDEATLDLPDVEDIPGQEHIRVPIMHEFADTTISSDDEEGEGLFDDEVDNVTPIEKELLRKSADENPDDEDRIDTRKMALDDMDEDGDLLNEKNLLNDREGKDLDMPEAEETTEEETENE